jgi:natural product precursor
MKKLSKLKLNVLNEQSLEERQMNALRGGDSVCTCSCYWANNGGSSSRDNSRANYNSIDHKYSNQGSNCYMYGCNDTCDECDFSYLTGS